MTQSAAGSPVFRALRAGVERPLKDDPGDQTVLATLRFSTALVCGHCISCQLTGTMG